MGRHADKHRNYERQHRFWRKREIGKRLLGLHALGRDDAAPDADALADKVANLRVFDDPAGQMNLSAVQVGGEVLVVSQFTLFGDLSRGNRPSFTDAMAPNEASRMMEDARSLLAARVVTQTGRFGANMTVTVENDGPVTIWIDSRRR